ncbi:hypothetical protein [Actinomyces weissii]|uniref:Uncharacterized protein n=1 Tax=Actinomyces weissii TaxID=675090 RepID=A0A7T7M9R8_9ACTO|nr:hypothetical protein [Actinomyces weissii]QQM67433.1 hypothetical protein JG540_00500 [Actinomyces weissii]
MSDDSPKQQGKADEEVANAAKACEANQPVVKPGKAASVHESKPFHSMIRRVKRHPWGTVVAVVGFFAALTTVIHNLQGIYPSPELQFTPKVYSHAADVGAQGGVNLTIRNSGNSNAVIDKAWITIEDYKYMEPCPTGLGDGGPIRAGVCRVIELPVDPVIGTKIDLDLGSGVDVPPNGAASISFPIRILGDKYSRLSVYLYKLNITLKQDDGTIHKVPSPIIVSLPFDDFASIHRIWVPDELVALGDDGRKTISKKQDIYGRYGVDSRICYKGNEVVLKGFLTGNAVLSPNLSDLREALNTGRLEQKNGRDYPLPASTDAPCL